MKLRALSKAGSLRHRVTFRQQGAGTDPWGAPTITWADFKTVWGEVMYLDGRELMEAKQANSEVQGRVRVRYMADIDPAMRIVYSGRELEILAILDYDAKRTEQHILFKERVI